MQRQAYSHAHAAGHALISARTAIAAGDTRGALVAMDEAVRLIEAAIAELAGADAATPELEGRS